MKVDLNRRFRGFDGNELGGDNIATAVAEALFNYGKDKPVGRDEKFKAYVLCQRIIQGGGILEITTEEGTLIKEVCGESLSAGGYGQVYELIEVGSLSGVKSLPAQKGDKLVNVPITLLSKPADDAAARAIKAAERVEGLAPEMEAATQETKKAIQTAGESAAKAEAAAKKAEDAIAQGYKHKEMSEEEFESLPEKDGKTIYLIYEEE